MPQASTQTYETWLKFAKEEIDDHGILMNIALNTLHENFDDMRGVFTKKDKHYTPQEKEYAALQYLIEEWDYDFMP